MYGACSQTCTNTYGSYRCSCAEGYILQPDRISCKAKQGERHSRIQERHHLHSMLRFISNNKQRGLRLIGADFKVLACSGRARLMWFSSDHIYYPHGNGETWSGQDNDKINEHEILSGNSLEYFVPRQCPTSP